MIEKLKIKNKGEVDRSLGGHGWATEAGIIIEAMNGRQDKVSEGEMFYNPWMNQNSKENK